MKKLPINPTVHQAVERYCKKNDCTYVEGRQYYKVYIGDGHLDWIIDKTNGLVYAPTGQTSRVLSGELDVQHATIKEYSHG